MKETGKNQEIDNLIEEEMRNAFGYGSEDLIADFDAAAEQMDESDCTPPKGEFERIVARVDEIEAEEKKSSKKVVRLRRVGKVGLLVAILGCVLMGTGIGASGKRAYEYELRASNQEKSIVGNNTGNLEAEYKLDEAYDEIKKRLGIDSLQLIRIPEKMKITELIFGEGYARMEFTREDGYIYFVQSQYPYENSSNTISDRKAVKNVFNKGLNKNLEIKENLLINNEVEYSTEFTIDKTYYYLAGVVSEEEFELMLIKIR